MRILDLGIKIELRTSKQVLALAQFNGLTWEYYIGHRFRGYLQDYASVIEHFETLGGVQ